VICKFSINVGKLRSISAVMVGIISILSNMSRRIRQGYCFLISTVLVLLEIYRDFTDQSLTLERLLLESIA
jgi:hypothetical protein